MNEVTLEYSLNYKTNIACIYMTTCSSLVGFDDQQLYVR